MACRDGARFENMSGRVVMRRAAAGRRRLLFYQNLEGFTPPLHPHFRHPCKQYCVGEKWKSKPNTQSRLIVMNGQVSIYIIEMDFGERHVKQPRRSDKFLKVADNTGNTVWPSARPFFLYLTEANRDLLFKPHSSSKTNTLPRILELGSGTGVLGFALATLGCEVVLTDPGLDVNLTDEDSLSHVQVNTLDVLKESAEVNRKLFTTPSELNPKGIPFHTAVRKLAWGSEQDIQAIQREFGVLDIGSESWSLRSGFDVIVGSDILYDPHKFPYLLKTLRDLARDDTDILLCGPVRKVESQFLKLAERDFEISQPLRPGLKLPHSHHTSFVFCLRKKGSRN